MTGGRRVVVSFLALVCIGCAVVIQAPQFFVSDWGKESLKAISGRGAEVFTVGYGDDGGLANATKEVTTVTAAAAKNKDLSVANVTLPVGNDAEKASIMQTIEPLSTKIITWHGLDGMHALISRHFKGNLFCEAITEARENTTDASLPITVKVSFGCKELFERGSEGTGNYISLLYGMRLAAQVYKNVDLRITCHDAEATKKELILPWLMGWFPPRVGADGRFSVVTTEEACGNYDTAPITRMHKEMRYDLRRMAIGLVGVPGPDHPSAKFAEKHLWSQASGDYYDEPPSWILQLPVPGRDDDSLYPPESFDLDDAVIHFRCGDLMASNHPSFGFMKFSGYTKYISAEARSIGILTQPFDEDAQSRVGDSRRNVRNRCRIVVTSLVDYLQDRFPSARIRIHNDSNETVALTYARMVMANQTIVGISSFGVFPVIATFGSGYLRRPDYRKAPNMWVLDPPIDNLTDNVILFDEPRRIMAGTMKRLWQSRGEEGVLEWFWNDTLA